ncbi:MAG: metal ABC transporter permease [Gemmatimonadetes bacterium]|jgi:zinc/manganese transport system permease protein|nr:metal ABC transporter permease [Gemmatimonadota bacterium]MBT5057729.1 metal ABC transporter permease [Gemmatimonadota bacterium]MBT5141359.1 metal ABC transporter permease [Gemmatimonadota bacterium]MBT5590440.1 metal ABC transporter permease [Gemmatimonadota bacterium]MBT5964277.1 metal ABC transporter permease [Gemmatimonadota bacterium]
MDFLSLMAAPIAACLLLVLIHAYLGVHILARGVIFVDLALAQIAALGAAVAILCGYELGSPAALGASLAATFCGAALFALTRSQRTDLPQEAIIGIVYVVAAAASILALDRSPHGAEHLKTVLVGQILWVSWTDVAIAGAVYLAVAAAHWVFRDRFCRLSGVGVSDTARSMRRARWWDFLFYASFGLVISISVPMAGVLLVFSFLIVPAVCAVLFSGNLSQRLIIAWATGFVVSVLGCTLSYQFDTPTGATIVCAFGVVLALLALVRRMTVHPTSRRTETHQ